MVSLNLLFLSITYWKKLQSFFTQKWLLNNAKSLLLHLDLIKVVVLSFLSCFWYDMLLFLKRYKTKDKVRQVHGCVAICWLCQILNWLFQKGNAKCFDILRYKYAEISKINLNSLSKYQNHFFLKSWWWWHSKETMIMRQSLISIILHNKTYVL